MSKAETKPVCSSSIPNFPHNGLDIGLILCSQSKPLHHQNATIMALGFGYEKETKTGSKFMYSAFEDLS